MYTNLCNDPHVLFTGLMVSLSHSPKAETIQNDANGRQLKGDFRIGPGANCLKRSISTENKTGRFISNFVNMKKIKTFDWPNCHHMTTSCSIGESSL
jgi:hypothetical protein